MPPSRSVETISCGSACMSGDSATPRGRSRGVGVIGVGAGGRARYFRWSQGPSGIHLARFVVNSSGHTVTSEPFCHCSM